MVEMGSHPTKRFLFNHTTPFLIKGLEKSLCDFTGTIFVQCENPVLQHARHMQIPPWTACGSAVEFRLQTLSLLTSKLPELVTVRFSSSCTRRTPSGYTSSVTSSISDGHIAARLRRWAESG